MIGTSGTMQYLTELGVALDEPAVLAVLTELAAPTMGELGRDGFVQGWGALKSETLQKQQSSLGLIRKRMFEDVDFFRKVYKHTFRMYLRYSLAFLAPVYGRYTASLMLVKFQSSPANPAKKAFNSRRPSISGASSSAKAASGGKMPRQIGSSCTSSFWRASGGKASIRICGTRRACSPRRRWRMAA